jgi:hypothetical protein
MTEQELILSILMEEGPMTDDELVQELTKRIPDLTEFPRYWRFACEMVEKCIIRVIRWEVDDEVGTLLMHPRTVPKEITNDIDSGREGRSM